MKILDKYGYLEEVTVYIEKNIINSKGWPVVLRKIKINKELLAELSSNLKKFSRNKFLANLKYQLEKRYSLAAGADAQVYGVDLKIDIEKKKPYLLLTLNFKITQPGKEDAKPTTIIKIFSKDIIEIKFNGKSRS